MGSLNIVSKKHGVKTVKYDDCDYDLVISRTWWVVRIKNIFYAVTRTSAKGGKKPLHIYMHRLILNPGNKHVDHKDRDGLNNQRSNIRFATPQQNMCNRRSYQANKTGYRGVHLQAETKSKYTAQIEFKGRTKAIHGFNSAREAAEAYNKLAVRYHGEFAILNVW